MAGEEVVGRSIIELIPDATKFGRETAAEIRKAFGKVSGDIQRQTQQTTGHLRRQSQQVSQQAQAQARQQTASAQQTARAQQKAARDAATEHQRQSRRVSEDWNRSNRKVDRDATFATARVSKRFGGMTASIGRSFTGLAGVAGAAFAGIGLVSFLKSSVTAASDLNETVSKTAVIFGKQALPELRAFAKGAAEGLGQSQQQALDAIATFGIFGQSAGLSGRELTKFSTGFTTLASDMASFNNTSPEEAITAIGAALRGESEPIRRYGVLIDDASTRQAALRLGLIKTTKEALTPQQRVLAVQQLIYQQTGKAQGDFARTSGGLANQQRILAANFANAKTQLGEIFLPVAQKFVGFLNTRMIPVFRTVIGSINAFAASFKAGDGDVTSSGMPGFFEKLGYRARLVFNYFKAEVLPRLREFGSYLRNTIIPAIRIWAETALARARVAIGYVTKAVRDNRPQLQALGQAVVNIGRWIAEKLLPFLARTSSVALPILGRAISTVIRIIGLLVRAFVWWKANVVPIINTIIRRFLDFVGVAINGAARAFGWVPGLGGKLRTAAAQFNTFKDGVNRSLAKISDQVVKITPQFSSSATMVVAGVRRSIPLNTIGSAGRGMATGGPVKGPGTTTSDSIPTRLSREEHVWSAREVAGAGGHRAVAEMRAMARAGRRGFATGGARGFQVVANTPSPRDQRIWAGHIGAGAVNLTRAAAQRMANTWVASQGFGGGGPAGPPGAAQRFRGVTLNNRTIRMVLAAERILGSIFRITQGSYSTRVAASGSTHAGGGAMDTNDAGRGWSRAVSALRTVGFAAWHRTPSQGPWNHHIHSIARGDPTASPAAKRQVQSYLRGGNGLGGAANGAWKLLRDQMLMVHRGEMVVPAAQAEELRRMYAGTGRMDGPPASRPPGRSDGTGPVTHVHHHYHFGNYVGDKNDLVKVLDELKRRGRV